MKNFLKPILAVLIFLFMQVVGSVIAIIYGIVTSPDAFSAIMRDGVSCFNSSSLLTPDAISVSLIISGLLTIICLYLFKYIDIKTAFPVSEINMKWAPIVVIGAFAGIFATNLLNEWVELPDLLQEQFAGMAKSVVGIIAIAILGPVTEELTFREAFIRSLLKIGTKPWLAIVLSALCFGLVHGNPAQIPFAFIIGVVLAIVYYKTGNIILSTIIHIINNSIAVIEMNFLGDHIDDISYRAMLGAFDIPLIVLLAIFCVFVLRLFCLRHPTSI